MIREIVKEFKTLKDFGDIKTENTEASSGHISIFLPMDTVGEELDKLYTTIEADFRHKFPQAGKKINISCFIVYSFGGWNNAEFELDIDVWDDNNEDFYMNYDEIKVNFSETASRAVKKLVCDALRKTILQ